MEVDEKLHDSFIWHIIMLAKMKLNIRILKSKEKKQCLKFQRTNY